MHSHPVGFNGQRRVRLTGYEEIEPALWTRDLPGKGPAQVARENLVARLPDAVARLEFGKINLAALEKQGTIPHFPNAAALFVVGIAAGIKHDAVARLDRRGAGDNDMIVRNRLDQTHERAALGAKPGRHERLVVHTVEPAGMEAAGERNF